MIWLPELKSDTRDILVLPMYTDVAPDLALRFERILAPDEIARAARFRTAELRRRFVVARGALRALLASHLKVPPGSIRFAYGPGGKPELDVPGLDFNVSHSEDLAVFALAQRCRIGIDVERIRPIEDIESIADRFFCREEAEELIAMVGNERERAFFLCWTRKEAYVKATGEGLSCPLKDFRVSLRPVEPARFVHIGRNQDTAARWRLHNLDLGSGYAAALAYRDRERSLLLLPAADPVRLAP